MFKTEWFTSQLQLCGRHGGIPLLCLFLAFLASVPASAQTDFTLTLNPPTLSPNAIAPGGVSSLGIQVATASGFTGTITLGCTVTPAVAGTVSNPVCTVSPPTLSATGEASASITTQTNTTAVSYGIAITATDASGTQTSPTLNLTVLGVIPQFTITIQSAIVPTSVPAGTGAQGVISINPINGYSSPQNTDPNKAGVFLACASMTPLVVLAPVCSFDPPNPAVTASTSATSVITVTTFGPIVVTGSIPHPRPFYALWLAIPMLALTGFGAAITGKRARKAWGFLALFILCGSLLLLPACGNTNVTTTTPNGVTPANTYTFSIIGVDANGVASSNTGSTTSAGPTVSLTVTAPPKQ